MVQSMNDANSDSLWLFPSCKGCCLQHLIHMTAAHLWRMVPRQLWERSRISFLLYHHYHPSTMKGADYVREYQSYAFRYLAIRHWNLWPSAPRLPKRVAPGCLYHTHLCRGAGAASCRVQCFLSYPHPLPCR